MNKVFTHAAEAIKDLTSGSSILMGGFGLTGVPENLISALLEKNATDLTCISNEAGLENFGIGRLIAQKQIRKMICSYIGENHLFEKLNIFWILNEFNKHSDNNRFKQQYQIPFRLAGNYCVVDCCCDCVANLRSVWHSLSPIELISIDKFLAPASSKIVQVVLITRASKILFSLPKTSISN